MAEKQLDIVDRLRDHWSGANVLLEAASEIERLRGELHDAKQALEFFSDQCDCGFRDVVCAECGQPRN